MWWAVYLTGTEDQDLLPWRNLTPLKETTEPSDLQPIWWRTQLSALGAFPDGSCPTPCWSRRSTPTVTCCGWETAEMPPLRTSWSGLLPPFPTLPCVMCHKPSDSWTEYWLCCLHLQPPNCGALWQTEFGRLAEPGGGHGWGREAQRRWGSRGGMPSLGSHRPWEGAGFHTKRKWGLKEGF